MTIGWTIFLSVIIGFFYLFKWGQPFCHTLGSSLMQQQQQQLQRLQMNNQLQNQSQQQQMQQRNQNMIYRQMQMRGLFLNI